MPAGYEKIAWSILLLAAALVAGCSQQEKAASPGPPEIPRGYVDHLQFEHDGALIRFGPFVGYYFKPLKYGEFSRMEFVCFNERRFYTLDRPENALLFTGEAVLTQLPDNSAARTHGSGRIQPVFFNQAPPEWLATRPEPQTEFVHFHSGYNAQGPVNLGFWLRHRGEADFIYDMGGRVGRDSPLYHSVRPGPDLDFPRIVEFDRGP